MSKAGKKIIAGLKEAHAVVRGEKKPARISAFLTLRFTLHDDGQFLISSPDLPQLRLSGPNPSVVCKALGIGLVSWLEGELWVKASKRSGGGLPELVKAVVKARSRRK
jgi:hypothetical protein